MNIVGFEEERTTKRKIARQNKDRKIEDEVEKLNEPKKKQNMKMNSIYRFRVGHHTEMPTSNV